MHKYGNVYYMFDNYMNGGAGYGLARVEGANIASPAYWEPYNADGTFFYGESYETMRDGSNNPCWTPAKSFELNTDYIFEYRFADMMDFAIAGFDYAAISEIGFYTDKLG